MAATPALPEFFEPLLAEQYEAADVQRILSGCNAVRPVTLRANALLANREEVASALDEAQIPHHPVSWYDDAFVIGQLDSGQERIPESALWNLPIYQEGRVYLQSLSSMIPVLVLDPHPGEDICDMCAAPGGKTTQIAALTGNGAYLTACEMHAPRAEKLQYNLRKLGAPNVTVMRVDARQLDDFFSFDRILLDAPCSGSGTLKAGDTRTAKRFTPALVQKSQKNQRALLLKALGLLKPGGTLVYSTCSVLACENEDIVSQCLRQVKRRGTFELQPILEDATEDADDENAPQPTFDAQQAAALPLLPTRLEGTLCLAPTDLYEGFFVAKIKRLN
jgi:ribosomal RNA methyltransferase Nop2